jgi:uncharacterized integral membrane protein
MGFLSRLAWFFIGLFVFSFAVLAVNQEQIALRFLAWETPPASLFWWILLGFVAGLAIAGTSGALVSFRHRRSARVLARQLAAAQQEIERLKPPVV